MPRVFFGRLLPRVALAASAFIVFACADDPVPPPKAADWPTPLFVTRVETSGDTSVETPGETPVDTAVEAPVEARLWGSSFVSRVELPDSELGPRTRVAVDPRTVDGIAWTGSAWKMEQDWDEDVDGGYIDFGAAALDLNGHRLRGFRIEVPPVSGSGHVIEGAGEVGYFEITNPQRYPHSSYFRNVDLAHHYIALGVAGDAIKVSEGRSVHHDAYIVMDVLPGSLNDNHYDGVQVFRSGSARLERIVIDWNDAGTLANTTGAIFTQDDASLEARDIVVLNPGGTWQIVRLGGSGPHDVDNIQVVGGRLPNNNQPEKYAPLALVRITNGSATFSLYNEVPGAANWSIPE